MNSSYEYMQRDLNYQKKTKEKLENELQKISENLKGVINEGHYLTTRVNNGRRYYYDAQHKGKKEVIKYIGNADNPNVLSRQELHYLATALANCNRNIKYLQAVLDNYKPIDPVGVVDESGKAYQGNYDVGRRIFKQRKPSDWVNTGLAERELHRDERPFPENLVLRTSCGELVRTRGEVIIANTLDSFKLPYVYEWPKMIAGKLRWPDFIVQNPKTKEIITIEYMGRFDDPEYREKNCIRLEEFYSEGYVLGQNLLAFMDDADGIIDSSKIHRIIKALLVD